MTPALNIDGNHAAKGRPRREDLRLRLSPEDMAVFDAAIADMGFKGPHARQDWLRAQIAGMAAQPKRRRGKGQPSHQRLPMAMPGGQEALALLGNVASDLRGMQRDLRRLHEWLDRIDPVFIADEHRERVRNELPLAAQRVIADVGRIEARIGTRLEEAIDAIHKAVRP
ncbi:hypothetical protein Sphch_3029 [Sphingobium chlorophenolicum L-1]|uniref:Uncharacterized protein n=1 Tax=Sphingobium chlorophenolicum L-1 TaxID=690566 RepID=F6F2J1_SPHCR|nr:hypothetical protein [Sphingobium chlorophenolicum]AEG50653.1 hypothetical protein Sphch_3029 [Sphingobium chlorophenolicum L-1]